MASVVIPAAYFLMLGAALRVFTSWTHKQVLVRSALLSVVCCFPLRFGGPMAVIAYVLLAIMAIRVLTKVFDAPMLAALIGVGAGTITSLGLALAMR